MVSDIPALEGNVANLFLRCSLSDSEELYDSFVSASAQLRGICVRWEVGISPSQPTGVESHSCRKCTSFPVIAANVYRQCFSQESTKKVTSPAWLYMPPLPLPHLFVVVSNARNPI